MSRFPLPLLVLPLAAAALGCNPQSADLTSGSFTAFLGINTSQIFVENKIPIEDFDNYWYIDCRNLPEGDPNLLEDREEICADGSNNGYRGVFVPETGGILHETWINRDAFAAVHETLDPWRGEAIITSENDLQLTFHHRLPGGQDMRFAFVVDPAFQPRVCEEADDGTLSLQPIDGDWVANWSENMTERNHAASEWSFPGYNDDGTLFLLNSGSYQFDPDQTTATWQLPPKMEAGFARARFGPEEMFFVTSRYARPRAYTNFDLDDQNGAELDDLYFLDTRELDPRNYQGEGFEGRIKEDPDYITMMSEGPELHANQTMAEFTAMYADKVSPPNYTPIAPHNAWRQPDDSDAGFDRWGELHYNWVRFDQPREQLAAGETVSGEFRLYFFGANSQSHMLVEGEFVADRVRNDTWTTRDVAAEKAEEADIVLCGGIPDGG